MRAGLNRAVGVAAAARLQDRDLGSWTSSQYCHGRGGCPLLTISLFYDRPRNKNLLQNTYSTILFVPPTSVLKIEVNSTTLFHIAFISFWLCIWLATITEDIRSLDSLWEIPM
jgi:hypothetical protein